MTLATAYPLTWPSQFPRAKWRENGKFKTALPNAIKNVHPGGGSATQIEREIDDAIRAHRATGAHHV